MEVIFHQVTTRSQRSEGGLGCCGVTMEAEWPSVPQWCHIELIINATLYVTLSHNIICHIICHIERISYANPQQRLRPSPEGMQLNLW